MMLLNIYALINIQPPPHPISLCLSLREQCSRERESAAEIEKQREWGRELGKDWGEREKRRRKERMSNKKIKYKKRRLEAHWIPGARSIFL